MIMKSKLYIILISLTTFFFISCSDFQKDKMPVLKCDISNNILEFEAKPTESQTIEIISETDWRIVIEQGVDKWVTVSPLDGNGNATLTFTANKNEGPTRNVMAKVVAEGAEEKDIVITQKGYSGIKYDFGSFDGVTQQGVAGSGITPITIEENNECEDGKAIKIYTRPGDEYMGTNGDRFKVATDTKFGSGRYEWRVYVPVFGMNDRTSIGAFVYFDDRHELDFEISSGTSENRGKYGAGPDDMLCLISSQANPFIGETKAIKGNAWHVLVLDLKLVDGKYYAEWLVDNERIHAQQLDYGEEEANFTSIISVENLMGMGDHAATEYNYAYFDYFEYVPYDYSMDPIVPSETPEPDGDITRWDFSNSDLTGWVNTNATFSEDGCLVLTHGANIKFEENVGAGKYTCEIDVPEIGAGEKWLSGINITANNTTDERSFSMFVYPGSEADRTACVPAPLPGQLLVRCYTESLGVYTYPINPGIHTLTLDLRLNSENQYEATWVVDGNKVKTYATWYSPEQYTFSLQLTTMANGGGWQGDIETKDTYDAKYSYFEYKKYKDE